MTNMMTTRKTNIFKEFLVFTLDSSDKKHIYVDFYTGKTGHIDLKSNEEADDLLEELFLILDPLVQLCNIESRSIIVNIDMKDANILAYKIDILTHIVEKLHKHIRTDRKNLTEKCIISNMPIYMKAIYYMIYPFIDKTFVSKIKII